MTNNQLTQEPIANTGMLIRRPVAEVFQAFIDPAITTQIWFTKSSGKLEPGAHLRWEWEMYGAVSEVTVKAIEPDRRILVEWSGYGAPTLVEWTFTSRPDGATFVSITNSGFSGTADEVVNQALDSVGGFTMVLAGLKALLEHGIHLNLTADRFPDHIVNKA